MTAPRWSWRALILPMVVVAINLPLVIRNRDDIAASWPMWRSVFLDLTLLAAGAVLVAALAVGVHAWRRGPHA